ncbi:transposase [Escherichia coli]|uniref:IS110 family transposase n=1 Tax=Escherichia coli TaxID=562 RepID=UPI0037C036CF
MTITTVGIDLAKNVFAVHCVDQNGKTVLVKSRVTRAALPGLIAGLPPCVIGMEACSGAHYWARLFRQYGHEPRLMAAKFVSPYRMAGKSGKNDAADAQAICEAVRRPHRGARRIRKKSYAKVFRASVRAETSRLPVCGSAARRNRRLG